MNSKTLFTGLLALLLLGALLVEFMPQRISPTVPLPEKAKAIVGVPPSEPAAPTLVAPLTSDPKLLSENSLAARDEGYRKIVALQSAGQFDQAAQFAANGPVELRRDWIITSYHEWGRLHPDFAFVSATQIQDLALRDLALQSVFSGWARTDPEGLAELALERPDGPEKTAALTKAMRAWLNKDPWKAGDWLAAHESVIPITEKMFRDDQR